MSFLDEFFKNNDLLIKVVTAVAAPGGIWVWVDKYLNRIQVKVRNLGLAPLDQNVRGIAFEAENIRSTMTSFEPEFTLTGYTSNRKKQVYKFRFDGDDRQLSPHEAKKFIAWHLERDKPFFIFLWFITFRLPLSRGRCIRVHVLNADGFKIVGFWRFHFQRILFLLFKRIPAQ